MTLFYEHGHRFKVARPCLVLDFLSVAPYSLSSRSHVDCVVQLSCTVIAAGKELLSSSPQAICELYASFSPSLLSSHSLFRTIPPTSRTVNLDLPDLSNLFSAPPKSPMALLRNALCMSGLMNVWRSYRCLNSDYPGLPPAPLGE